MFCYASDSSIDFQTCNVLSFESSDSDNISSNHQDVEATPQNAKPQVYVWTALQSGYVISVCHVLMFLEVIQENWITKNF